MLGSTDSIQMVEESAVSYNTANSAEKSADM
jgi:hypothetical protein